MENKNRIKELVRKALMQEADIEVMADKYGENHYLNYEKTLGQATMMLDALEELLKKHDFYYMMSDDSRVYNQGSSKQSEIRKIMKSLEDIGYGKDAKILYNKYSPFKMTEGKKEDVTGDGKIDSKDYLLKRDAAIKKAKGEMQEAEKPRMFVTGGSINPELRKKVEQFVKGVAKYYDYSVDDAFLAIMTILKGGLNKNTTNELLYNPNETHGEFEVGDIVKYKDKDHEVTRIEPDRIYIRPTGTSMIGKLNHFWVKREDLNENTGLKKGDTVEFEGTKYKIGDFDTAGGANLVYLDTMGGKPAEDSKGSYLKVHATKVKPSMNEDIDLGHQDNEPHMIKGDLYQIGKYAMELYAVLEEIEETNQEVDFPAWWQSKITVAKENMDGAKHYLEFEINEPKIDAAVDALTGEEPHMGEPESHMMNEDEIGKADILSGELYKLKGKIQDAFFDKIRKFINMGSYEDAEYLLNRVKGQMKEKSLAETIAQKLKSK